jgi:hypothetical protein
MMIRDSEKLRTKLDQLFNQTSQEIKDETIKAIVDDLLRSYHIARGEY